MEENIQNLRICVSTWNVANCDPLKDKELEEFFLLSQKDQIDIYAVGLQEIKTGARETVSSFIYYDAWAREFSKLLSEKGYFMVESVRVQGISLSVFAKLTHLPYIRFIETEIERTGIAGAWGNKGGTAISCWLYGQKICFLNVHLSAHLWNCKGRLDDIKEIFDEMEFGGKSTVLNHDLILMFGDVNFRIDEFSREFIIETVKKKNYSVLWEEDQLKKSSQKDEIISQFTEPLLEFDPTYKYDTGTDVYDSSTKKRKPAWTDRILWRIHPEVTNSKDPPFFFNVVDSSFTSLTAFKQSDHKPVTCQFDFQVKVADAHQPFLTIEPIGNWSLGKDGEFSVEIEEGMRWNGKDYICLFKDNFKDFRTYETYMYLEPFEDSSSEDEAEGLAQKIARCVKLGAGVKTKSYKMSKSLIKELGEYRLGYYSFNTSSVVALSRPFVVCDQ